MKTSITSRGVVDDGSGDGFYIYDHEHHEAPFDDRWDDEKAELHEGTGQAALTYEAYRDTGFFMKFFRHNQDDNIFLTFQMSHQWDTTTSIRPHMHFFPMSSGSGNVLFNYAYAWTCVGGALSSSSGWTSGSITFAADPSMQYNQKIASFGTIAPLANSKESNILVFKVERSGTDPSDTYVANKDHGTAAANVGIMFFDAHYQKIKAGSVIEFGDH